MTVSACPAVITRTMTLERSWCEVGADGTVGTAWPAGRATRRADQMRAVDRFASGRLFGDGKLGQDC